MNNNDQDIRSNKDLTSYKEMLVCLHDKDNQLKLFHILENEMVFLGSDAWVLSGREVDSYTIYLACSRELNISSHKYIRTHIQAFIRGYLAALP